MDPVQGRVRSVALVGTGVIGRGWIRVFTRAGLRVRLHDLGRAPLEAAQAWLAETLDRDVASGRLSGEEAQAQRDLVSAHVDLAEAVAGCGYVQESGPEEVSVKRSIFTALDEAAPAEAVLASSTSTLDMNLIAGGLPGERRCLMAHPFNPPYIIPVVEVMGCRETEPGLITATTAFLESVGLKPVIMRRYAFGYLLNRIQAAVVREAVHMVASGLASVEDVDTVIRDGLALRWVILGNFGTNHTNADGGIREYYTRYGHVYQAIQADLDPAPAPFSPELIEEIGRQVDDATDGAGVTRLSNWRDETILKLRAFKDQNPPPKGG